MNVYEQVYEKYQIKAKEDNLLISRVAVLLLERLLSMKFDYGFNSINTILRLINSGYKELLYPILDDYNYNDRFEIPSIIINLCYNDNIEDIKEYRSLLDVIKIDNGYKLKTKYGNVVVYKVNKIYPKLWKYTRYSYCHDVCLDYIKTYGYFKNNRNMCVNTGLLDFPFCSKFYHSFISYNNYVMDLSHNAFMKYDDYMKLFNPVILNKIKQDELYKEEERINSQESLGNDKNLLLRLALDKQCSK